VILRFQWLIWGNCRTVAPAQQFAATLVAAQPFVKRRHGIRSRGRYPPRAAVLQKERANLVASIAIGGNLDDLVAALKERGSRRQTLEQELQASDRRPPISRTSTACVVNWALWRGRGATCCKKARLMRERCLSVADRARDVHAG
jgi:hypothetical protein